MIKATHLIPKRLGMGKNADLLGLTKFPHQGDSKRTSKEKRISKKQHNIKTYKTHHEHNVYAEHNRELVEYYARKF